MKTLYIGISFWLFLFSSFAPAETMGTQNAKCQKFAHEFSQDPTSLSEDQLKYLQFCVTNILKERYESNPPELLKGTIIEPPASSAESPDTISPSLPPGGQK